MAFAKNPNPGVIPPHAHYKGMTYSEWSEEHWKWTYSLPVDHHPFFDTADCSEGQSGKVWFLGGTFTASPTGPGTVVGTADRNCTVPVGIALFFPILNAECSTLEGNGVTEEELRACATSLMDHARDLQAEIDGVPIKNLADYRVQSSLFTFGPLPGNNVLGATPGATSPSVADGVYLMLAPLSKGEHTIHFFGKAVFTQAEDGFDFSFTLDIAYHLTVTSGKKL